MPNRDETGPNGEGPKTGRQLGKCQEAEPQKRFGNRGRPCRRGSGRGFGRRFAEEEQKE